MFGLYLVSTYYQVYQFSTVWVLKTTIDHNLFPNNARVILKRLCGLDIENRKGSSLLKTEDSEGAIITLHSTNASELRTDEHSAHWGGH